MNHGKSNDPVLMPTLMSPHTLVARLNAHEMVPSQSCHRQSIVAHHDPNAGKSIHMYARVSLRDSNDPEPRVETRLESEAACCFICFWAGNQRFLCHSSRPWGGMSRVYPAARPPRRGAFVYVSRMMRTERRLARISAATTNTADLTATQCKIEKNRSIHPPFLARSPEK